MQSVEKQLFSSEVGSRSIDRVKAYLEKEFLDVKAREGTRLPPVRLLARQLSVSSATLIKATRQLEAEGRLITKEGSGIFITERPEGTFSRRCVTLATTWPDEPNRPENAYSHDYQQSIAQAGVRNGRRVSLLPLGSREWSKEETLRRVTHEREFVDGLLVLPLLGYTENDMMPVADAYREIGKPVVSFSPVFPLQTQNFVGLDHQTKAREVTVALTRSGRKNILFLLHVPISESHSAAQQFLGMHLGLAEAGTASAISVLQCGGASEAHGFEAVSSRLKGGRRPFDAVVAAGQFLALGAVRALNEQGFVVPDDASVFTLSGLREPHSGGVDFSGMINPFDLVGERLISMALKQIQEPSINQPGEYVSMLLHCGSTTSPGENALLEKRM